jgi:serine/threonine protein kinase
LTRGMLSLTRLAFTHSLLLTSRPSPRMCDAHLDLTTEAESWNGNVIARLGEGAQGEVLLGDNMDGRGHVAIKVGLRVGAIDREAAVLSAMTGVAGFPKVLHYKAAGPNDGGMLVMELLGPSVQDLWQRTLSRTHVVSPTLLRVARGALRRLRQLHLAGFVHNDVKPANLLLGASSGSLRQANEIHLIDFGLASRCGAACEQSHHNDAEPQQPIGTPSFASLAAHQRRRPMRPVDDIEVHHRSRSKRRLGPAFVWRAPFAHSAASHPSSLPPHPASLPPRLPPTPPPSHPASLPPRLPPTPPSCHRSRSCTLSPTSRWASCRGRRPRARPPPP